MKGVKKILFTLIIVGLSLTPFFYSINAQQVTESYSGYWYANLYNDYQFQNSQSQQGFADIVIITTSDYAAGTIRITRFTGYDTFEYQGKYTYYSHVPISNQALITSDHLTGTFTDQATYTEGELALNATQLQDILDAIDDVDTTDEAILSYLPTIKTDIESKLIDLISAVNNIDNLIDTISWIPIENAQLQYSLTWNGSLINTTGNIQQNNIFINLPVTNDLRRNSSIYHLRLGIDKVTVSPAIFTGSLYYISSGGERTEIQGKIYIQQNRQYIDIYIYNMRLYYESNMRLELSIPSGNLYVYSVTNGAFEYIKDSDIEYWQLLAYFETHEYYQNEYPDIDNANNSLTPAVDDYIDQEDNLINDFDTAINDSAVDPSSNTFNPGNFGNTFIQSIGFVGSLFNSLVSNNNPFFLMINFSLMLGLALLVIGKRA